MPRNWKWKKLKSLISMKEEMKITKMKNFEKKWIKQKFTNMENDEVYELRWEKKDFISS